jgi:hypothetical protein
VYVLLPYFTLDIAPPPPSPSQNWKYCHLRPVNLHFMRQRATLSIKMTFFCCYIRQLLVGNQWDNMVKGQGGAKPPSQIENTAIWNLYTGLFWELNCSQWNKIVNQNDVFFCFYIGQLLVLDQWQKMVWANGGQSPLVKIENTAIWYLLTGLSWELNCA